MERQVNHTVYSLLGVTSILEDIDTEVVRPLNFQRYGIGPSDSPKAPKMIIISGKQGQGLRSMCSALVNELRRGRSNKRGDVYYKNRDVKFLEWQYQRNNHECLSRALEQAKKEEFTVLTIHGFEMVCSLMNVNSTTRLGQEQAATKKVLMDYLNTAEPGKVLLVLTTSDESACDKDVFGKADYKYFIPLPDAETREEMIWKLLENENAQLTPYSLMETLVHSMRHSFTIEDVVYVVNGAIRQAKERLREQQRNGSSQTETKVLKEDFTRYLDLVYETRAAHQEEDSDEEESEDGEMEELRLQLPHQGRPAELQALANGIIGNALQIIDQNINVQVREGAEDAEESDGDEDDDELVDEDEMMEDENEVDGGNDEVGGEDDVEE